MHLKKTFSKQLAKYLSRSDCDCTKLIKLHDTGDFDFSFPTSCKIWDIYLRNSNINDDKTQDNILRFATEDYESDNEELLRKLKEISSNFIFAIETLELKNYRCSLTLQRDQVYKNFLTNFTSSYGKRKKTEDETVHIEVDTGDECITQYRVNLIGKVLQNLIGFSRYFSVNDPSIAKYKILVTSKSNFPKDDERSARTKIICGTVLDPVEKKASKTSSVDYIKKRSDDMHLISIHKYGVRAKNSEEFVKLVDKLGISAVTLELLEVRPPSPLTLNPDLKQAFILYNSARLETLMEKFESKVEEGYYQPLPDIADIDTKLLKENEEWNLMKILLTFPDVIDHTVDDLENGKVAINSLHKFISSLAYAFSVYYRRVQLLTENRSQLMLTLHAKIHFLKAVRGVFNQALGLFNIEPVAFM